VPQQRPYHHVRYCVRLWSFLFADSVMNHFACSQDADFLEYPLTERVHEVLISGFAEPATQEHDTAEAHNRLRGNRCVDMLGWLAQEGGTQLLQPANIKIPELRS